MILGGLPFSGCDSQPTARDRALATVDGEPITLSEFQTFSAAIPEGMKKGQTPLEKERQVLESLIDKKLLLREAAALDLAEDPALREELDAYSRNRLVELYTKKVVVDPIGVADEEMEAHFRASHRDRALRFSGIMLESREEAEEILQKVRSGADFMELARGHSLHRESGEQGGDVGLYKLKDKVHPAIASALFHLQVGQLSEPVPLNYEGRLHHAVFQVTDEMPVPLAASERKIRQELFAQKRTDRFLALLDSLKTAHAPHIEVEQVGWLAAFGRQSPTDTLSPPAERAAAALCTIRDGQISIAEFLQVAREIRAGRPELADSSRIAYLLQEIVIPARLFLAEARAAGLQSDPELLQRIASKREDLLLSTLRQRLVDENLEVSEAEARAFYDAHPEKFTSPMTSEIVEILVPSDTLAQRLRDEMLAGADPESLAAAHTQRPGADHHGGRLTLNFYSKAYYQDIYERVEEVEVDHIEGPLRVPGGYSVFKVLDRYEKKAPYDASSRRRAEAYVKIDKSKRGYVRYVRDLRQKYPVEVFDAEVERAFAR